MKSPFRGASRRDLSSLRTFAEAVRDWEKRARRGQFSSLRSWEVLGIPIWDVRWEESDMLRDFLDRAWERLRKREDWDTIYEAYDLWWLRKNQPAAYEVKLLRKELQELRDRYEEEKAGG